MSEQKSFRDWFLDSFKEEEQKEKIDKPTGLLLTRNNWMWLGILSMVGFYLATILPSYLLTDTILAAYKTQVSLIGILLSAGSMLYCFTKSEYYKYLYDQMRPQE